MAQTAKAYEYSTFRHYFSKVARSGLFNREKISPYYRKPAQYLAAAMAIAAYNEGGAEAAIREISRSHKLCDRITLQ